MTLNDKLKDLNSEIEELRREEQEKLKEAKNYVELIYDNSFFDKNIIGRVLADLYGILIGEKTYYISNNGVELNGISGMILLEKDKIKFDTTRNDFSFLVSCEKSIAFYSGYLIHFYKIDEEEKNKIRFSKCVKPFPDFLKDYIDYVIDYRVNHQEELKGEINEEKLMELEHIFLKLKRDELSKIYEDMEIKERKELESKVLRRKNALSDLYKK